MKVKLILLFIVLSILYFTLPANAFQTAPRITDKQIIQRLTKLEDVQKAIREENAIRFNAIDKRFDAVNKRIDDLRAEMNSKFTSLQWMLGVFISIVIIMLGFVLRMQWQLSKRHTAFEATLKAHDKDINFIKEIIKKLMPPSGVL